MKSLIWQQSLLPSSLRHKGNRRKRWPLPIPETWPKMIRNEIRREVRARRAPRMMFLVPTMVTR
jgi:hypothetical protein